MNSERRGKAMNHESGFMMNEGVLFLSYAYALTGFCAASVLLAITAAIMAVLYHSPRRFCVNLGTILACTFIQLPLLLVSGLSGLAGTIGLLAFCNAVVSVLWMESSFKAIRTGMRILIGSFPVFLYLSILIPEAALFFVMGQQAERSDLILLCLMMYLPVLSGYAFKTGHRSRRRHGRMYNRSHSGKHYDLADHTLY